MSQWRRRTGWNALGFEMKNIVFLALASVLLTGCAGNGSDHQAIRSLSQDFFDAMEQRDVEMASRLVIPEGVFVHVRSIDGQREIRSSSNAAWLERLGGREKEVHEAFTESPFILVEGDIATLWAAYEFEVDGHLSHTGIDAINFVRTEDGWRIAGGVYSVIRAED
jgi:ketosteroid isomerase-like protein